nr:15 kDa excretory/secretory protein [Haemonchus contortus]
MLFAFTVLASFQALIAAQGTEKPLPKESKDTFETLNMLYSDNLVWSDEWAKKALKWLKKPEKVQADMIINGTKSFPKEDAKLLWQKLLGIFESRFEEIVDEIEQLPAGTIYGCNGITKEVGNEDVISTVCLYKRP